MEIVFPHVEFGARDSIFVKSVIKFTEQKYFSLSSSKLNRLGHIATTDSKNKNYILQ